MGIHHSPHTHPTPIPMSLKKYPKNATLLGHQHSTFSIQKRYGNTPTGIPPNVECKPCKGYKIIAIFDQYLNTQRQ